MSDKWPIRTDNGPTIKVAAERPYCAKHSRAMLVIGGEAKCASCLKEQRDAEEKRA